MQPPYAAVLCLKLIADVKMPGGGQLQNQAYFLLLNVENTFEENKPNIKWMLQG